MNKNMALMIGERESKNLFEPFLVQINDNTLIFVKEHIFESLDTSYSNMTKEHKAIAKSINNSIQKCDTLTKLITIPYLYVEEVPILNSN